MSFQKKKVSKHQLTKDQIEDLMEKYKNIAEEYSDEFDKILDEESEKAESESLEFQRKLIGWYDNSTDEYYTIDDIVDRKKLDLSSLAKKEMIEIAIRRIEQKKDYSRLFAGHGKVDQKRALREIGFRESTKKRKKPTDLGKILIELEMREINITFNLIKEKETAEV